MNIIGVAGRAGVGKDSAADVLVKHHGFVKVAFADPLKRVAMDLWGFSEEQLWGTSSKRNDPDPRWPKDHVWGNRNIDETGMFTVCSRCNIKGALINGADDPPKGATEPCVALSPRESLQILGTEVGRSIHEQTWTTYLFRIAEKIFSSNGQYKPTVGWIMISPMPYQKRVAGIVVPDLRFPNEANAIKRQGGRVWLVDRPGIGLTGRAGAHVSETSMENYAGYDAVLPNGPLETLAERVRSIL
jgi:hypothetical protein